MGSRLLTRCPQHLDFRFAEKLNTTWANPMCDGFLYLVNPVPDIVANVNSLTVRTLSSHGNPHSLYQGPESNRSLLIHSQALEPLSYQGKGAGIRCWVTHLFEMPAIINPVDDGIQCPDKDYHRSCGTGTGTRTRTPVRAGDFKSPASASSAIPAQRVWWRRRDKGNICYLTTRLHLAILTHGYYYYEVQ